MFLKIIIFALQQIKIFQNHPLCKIRIFLKNIHPSMLMIPPYPLHKKIEVKKRFEALFSEYVVGWIWYFSNPKVLIIQTS